MPEAAVLGLAASWSASPVLAQESKWRAELEVVCQKTRLPIAEAYQQPVVARSTGRTHVPLCQTTSLLHLLEIPGKKSECNKSAIGTNVLGRPSRCKCLQGEKMPYLNTATKRSLSELHSRKQSHSRTHVYRGRCRVGTRRGDELPRVSWMTAEREVFVPPPAGSCRIANKVHLGHAIV